MLKLHAEPLRDDWLDAYGHLNEAYYLVPFSNASWALQDHFGIGVAYFERDGGAGQAPAASGTAATATSSAVEAVAVQTVAVQGGVVERVELRLERVREARIMGFEGDSCGECGNFTMVRNGTCMKCTTCGATSGCS